MDMNKITISPSLLLIDDEEKKKKEPEKKDDKLVPQYILKD